MFKESQESTPQDLFSSVAQNLNGSKLKELEDGNGWQNQFYREVTSRIDESVFKPLYAEKYGRPNASARILTAMILLKEGQGWTDAQLYENCRYNLKAMRALGLTNLSDEVPVPSTYYDFKLKLDQYHRDEGVSIFDEVFKQITQDQIGRYKITGSEIRIDSKLIQTNIRNYTRLQKILQAIQVFQSSLGKEHKTRLAKKADKAFLIEIMSKTPENHTYGMKNEEKEEWLGRVGFLMRKLVNIYTSKDSPYYEALKRMLEEQYDYEDKRNVPPTPKDPKKIAPDSMQSIHDEEATFRRKGQGHTEQQVSGYSVNITENCKEDEIALITDVRVEKSTYSDNEYLIPSIEATEQLTHKTVTDIWTDGGYDSIENRMHLGGLENKKKWHLSKTKGSTAYEFAENENGDILVKDTTTNVTECAVLTKKGAYRIRSQRGKQRYVYFKKENVKSYLLLNNIRPKTETSNKRANVEATIHQIFCTPNGKKTRYRGKLRNILYAISRCIWVNFRRIADFWIEKSKKDIQRELERLVFMLFFNLRLWKCVSLVH
jgi:hypothetical protein